MKKQFDVPYNPATGDLLDAIYRRRVSDGNGGYTYEVVGYSSNPDGSSETVVPRWAFNEPFPATLTYLGFCGSRGTNYLWRDRGGSTYPMFPSEMDEVLRTQALDKGTFSGTFIAVKRGSAYGIALYNNEI